MDITTLFKTCVTTVHTSNKALGVKAPKQDVFSRTQKDINLKKAKEIVKQITNLQNFFLENKAAYLNVINYLSSNKTLTEVDRQQIDVVAESIISRCTNLIRQYKKEIATLSKSEQKEEHYYNVIETLEKYLKSVSKIYTEAKAVRVKRVIETHKLSKLEMTIGNQHPIKTGKSNKGNLESNQGLQQQVLHVSPPINYDEELSAEDLQMFKTENDLLFNELNSFSNEVKQMESKVVYIAELQEQFTENVLQQEKDIERISTTVVGATENMKDANDQIRQAMQRNAGLRVWVLFFLLVMSFSLLFLDWYND